jgi:hypothetical protein
MQTCSPYNNRKVTLLLLSAAVATCSFAQGTLTLIGPTTRNGSFEDGILSPWTTSAGSVSVIQNPSIATHGRWFADVSITAQDSMVQASIFMELAADPAEGRTFDVTFDARNETFPFAGIRVLFATLDKDAVVKFTTNRFFALPQQGWQTYRVQFQVPEVWDNGSLSLGLRFEPRMGVPGRTYRGYLDNIVLQQIPEPSVFALCGVGIIFWAAGLLRRRNAFET